MVEVSVSTVIDSIIAFFEFSRNSCVSFCALLVPANLLLTVITWSLVVLSASSTKWVLSTSLLGNTLSLVLILHVVSWWAVGVVAAPSFILVFLGGVCLTLNLLAMIFSEQVQSFWRTYVKNGGVVI